MGGARGRAYAIDGGIWWCYDDDDGSGGATVVVVAAWSGEAVGGVAVLFIVETTLDCFGYLIFGLDQACISRIDAIDGLDGTERGCQGLCLGEMFCLFKQKDALEKKSYHDF
ncbi:hypothetical protein Tco_1183371 [Tanacetum coccineum]